VSDTEPLNVTANFLAFVWYLNLSFKVLYIILELWVVM